MILNKSKSIYEIVTKIIISFCSKNFALEMCITFILFISGLPFNHFLKISITKIHLRALALM